MYKPRLLTVPLGEILVVCFLSNWRQIYWIYGQHPLLLNITLDCEQNLPNLACHVVCIGQASNPFIPLVLKGKLFYFWSHFIAMQNK